MTTHDFQHYLSEFLARFLPGEVGSATNTIRSYRDTFTLFLRYCKAHEDITPEHMTCDLLTKDLVERFLTWLEAERGCVPATRNQRLAAIRSFCRYLQARDAERIGQYQRVLAIPKKKTTTASPRHLSLDGIRLILDQPDTSRPSGRRDLALLALIYDTGARVQEIADLTLGDLRTDPPATVKLTGKGNKTRIVPLMLPTVTPVRRYADGADLTGPASRSRPLFPNRGGTKMTRSGIAYILDKHVTAAREANPAALPDTISPHTLRHSKAMHLLQAGVNLVYIRDILGHADLKTTEIYARIDGEMKRRALQSAFTTLTPPDVMPLWHQDEDRPNMTTAANPASLWLFPGRRAGQAMDPGSLRDLLQEIGIPAQSGRTAAFRQLVLQMPPPVVAQALGYHHNSTTRIAAEAGASLPCTFFPIWPL